jgi:hypothetical protein
MRVSASSFRHTLRRRIAPVAFLGVLVLLGARTCATEAARVEIRLDLGAAAAGVDALRVDVFPAGAAEGVAYFERHGRPVADALGFEARLDPGTYLLRIEARTASGVRTLERTVVVGEQLGERTVISLDLEPALLAAPSPGAE